MAGSADFPREPAEAAPPLEHTLSVLVVDDAGDSRQLLQQMLRHFARVSVEEAAGGAEAVNLFRAGSPNLVFLDLDMPEMDGLAALRAMREIDANAFVVIVSGHSSATNVNEALALGAGGFVVKPYSAGRILQILKRCESRLKRSFLIQRGE
jgi:two-component system, chemotaxis family, chemotaxis protein CheY